MRVRGILAGVSAAVMAAGGVLLAGAPAASAADLGSYSANCEFGGGRVDVSISGQVGDTFTVTGINNTSCFGNASPTGVIEDVVSTIDIGGGMFGSRAVVTIVAAGSATYRFEQNGNGSWFAINMPASSAAVAPTADAPPIPSWVQAYGIFHRDDACLTGWTNSWQKWAEPITGGWVCGRTIPSLG